MATAQERLDDLEGQVDRLMAMNDALQAFVISMFRLHPDRQLIMTYYEAMQRPFLNEALYDGDVSESLLEAFHEAHERLKVLAATKGFQP